MSENNSTRRRHFDSAINNEDYNAIFQSPLATSTPREGYTTPVTTPRGTAATTPKVADTTDSSTGSFQSCASPKSLSISMSKDPDYFAKVMNNPEVHFDQIIQKANEYVSDVQDAIYRFRNSKSTEINLIDTESQIEKTLLDVSKIALQLQDYIEEVSTRRSTDAVISARILTGIKTREASLNELVKSIRDTKKDMQFARTERARKDLMNEWTPYDRASRTPRDAEEIMSDSTERMLNSKRILLETIQASSGTLGSLATSSQSVQKNDEELHTQTGMVSSAHSLLQKYGRRASTDKLLIWLGFIFFGFCALFVAYRRLF